MIDDQLDDPALVVEEILKAQGNSLGIIAAKTGIPTTSLRRYLND